jgi:hypothetical protein
MPIPIVRTTGNELMDLFQRSVVEFFKEISAIFTRGKPGLVPPSGGSGTTRFLREDGTWAVP